MSAYAIRMAALNIRPRAYLPLLVGVANIVAHAPRSADDGALVGAVLLFMIASVLSLWWRLT
jgi:hypothetical protein